MEAANRRFYSAAELLTVLKQVFKFDSFRDSQLQIIRTLLAGNNVIAVLATGGGKSLCYQLPAIMNPHAVAIVVSPLIALMNDQVAALNRLGIKATYVHSQLTTKQIMDRMQRLERCEYRLFYVSPERLQTESFLESVEGVPVSLLAVDEGHCVSMWGHDFRPEYSRISDVYERLGNPPVAVFTGTARPNVIDDIATTLRIPDAERIVGDLDRPNLKLRIEKFPSAPEATDRLFKIVRAAKKAGKPATVYSLLVGKVNELEFEARARKLPAVAYHGQLNSESRQNAEARFMNDEIPLIISTSAFGMGIDKPNIHCMVHYGLPPSLEHYWQEVSRSGRDGTPVDCTLILPPGYDHDLRSFVRATHPSLKSIERTYRFFCGAVRNWRGTKPPSIYFDADEIVGKFGSNFFHHDLSSSLAVLQDQGVLALRGPRLHIFVSPDEVQRRGYLIDTKLLDARRLAAEANVEQVIRYTKLEKNLRPTIVSYLKGSDLPDPASEQKKAKVERDTVVESIVLAIAHRNLSQRELLNYLCGYKPLDGAHFGILKGTLDREIRRAQDRAITNSLIVERDSFGAKLWTVTNEGYAFLADCGLEVVPPKSYAELLLRLHNPREREMLAGLFRDWLDRANEAPESHSEVLERKLTICGEPLDGSTFVKDFCRIDRRPRASDATMFLRVLRESVSQSAV